KLNRCDGGGNAGFDPGVSGLALLAYLAAGDTHQSGDYKDTVKNGLKHLRDVQDADGCFGPRVAKRFLHDDAAAAAAMIEAYGMPGSRVFHEAAQRAVGFVLKAKNPYLAWRYAVPPNGENDTAVTGWMALALKSAHMSEILPDEAQLAQALAWIDKV